MPFLSTFAAAAAKSFGLTASTITGALKDLYFNIVSLLVNAEPVLTPITNDESANNFGIAAIADAKASLFSPYQGHGYYSVQFNGSTDNLTVAQTFGLPTSTTPFTMEAWVYVLTYAGCAIASTSYAGGGAIPFVLGMGNTSTAGGDAGQYPFLNYYNGSAWATGVKSTVPVTQHTWSHIAGVFDGTNAKIYVNGVLGGTWASGTWQTTGQANFYIGRRWDTAGTNFFDGYISNFRLVIGTAVYSTEFTPPKSPLTAITNTTLLLSHTNRFIDTSSNAYAVTTAGKPLVSRNLPFAYDSNTSTLGSVYLDGTGDYLQSLITTTKWDVGLGDLTVEFWIYYTTAPVTGYGLVDTRGANTSVPWAIWVNSTNFPYFTDPTTYTSTVAFTLGAWNHFAACRTSGILKLFVNGVQGYSAANTVSWVPAQKITIGTYALTGAAGYYVPGYMADVRITTGTGLYTTAFTPPTTLLSLLPTTQLLTCRYNGGVNNYGIIDSGPLNYPITRVGNTSQGTFSPFSQTGWSTYFNGSTDYLTVPAAATTITTSNFTFEVWVYVNSLSAANVVIDIRNSVSPNAGFQMAIATTGALSWFEGSATQVILAATGTITTGKWFHIAFVRAGTGAGQCAMYVNGVSKGTGTSSLNYSGYTSYIGRNAAAAQDYMNGYISNMRLVNGVVLYTGAFVPSTSPLIPVTGTLLLTCQSNRVVDNAYPGNVITQAGTPAIRPMSPFSGVSEIQPVSYSYYFDGTGDNILTAADTRFAIGTSPFTCEFWIYFNTVVSLAEFIQSSNDTTVGRFVIYFNGTAIQVTANGGAGPTTANWTPVTNRWYHVAATRDASNNQSLFIDGVLLATATSTNNYTQAGFVINKNLAFNGYLSNLRLVVGSALYTASFTPSTTPLTTTSQGAVESQVIFLTAQSSTISDTARKFVWTTTGDSKPKTFNPFGFNPASLVTSYVPSLHGGSAYFDGTGDYLTIANSTTQQLMYNFTIECWVYLISATTSYFFSMGQTGIGQLGIAIFASAADWRMQIGTATAVTTVINTATIKLNQWYHVAVSRNNTTIRMYVNGLPLTTTATVSATLTGIAGSGIAIGAFYNGSFTAAAACYVSDVRITQSSSITNPPLYTAAFLPPSAPLTSISTSNYATMLLANFTNGGIVDSHSSMVFETGNNLQTSTVVKKFNKASLYFGGTNSAVAFNALNQYLVASPNQSLVLGAGDFTVEFWMYPLGYPGVGLQSWLVDFRPTSASTGAYIKMYITANGASMVIYGGATSATLLVTSATMPLLSTWTHVAFTRQGTNFKLFFNGVQTGATATDSTNYTLNGLFVGTQPTLGNSPYYGYMDDFRITVGLSRYNGSEGPPGPMGIQ